MVLSSRRGSTSSETHKDGEPGCPTKGKWSPRGTGNRQAPPPLPSPTIYPCPTASRVSVAARGRARVTGNAGENGRHSGEMGGSSPWTRPSAPECGDTLKASAGDLRPILGGDRPRRRLRGGSPAGRTPPHGDGSMYSQANVRAGKCAAAPYPSVAVRDRGH